VMLARSVIAEAEKLNDHQARDALTSLMMAVRHTPDKAAIGALGKAIQSLIARPSFVKELAVDDFLRASLCWAPEGTESELWAQALTQALRGDPDQTYVSTIVNSLKCPISMTAKNTLLKAMQA